MQKKILIVEDDKALASLLSDRFKSEDFAVAMAGDGEEGLKQAISWLPDLILLDVVMPRMDGITMLHKLRQHAEGKTVQVVLLTNLSDKQKVYEAMSDGVYDYLIKSNWDVDDVVKEVRAKLTPAQ